MVENAERRIVAMTAQHFKTRAMPVLVCVLFLAVAVLAVMLFQTHTKLEALTDTNRVSVTIPAPSKGNSPATAQIPRQGQPWQLFNAPFDPDHWDPFSEMDEMHRRIDAMFNDAFGRFGSTPAWGTTMKGLAATPRMDLSEEEDKYVVRLDVPGAENADINVTLKDGVLSVETASAQENDEETNNFLRRERRIGKFHRQITLPGPASAENMTTDYKDGVLTITIGKSATK
jgi:HSP20 family protein